MKELMIQVERVVRPIRADTERKGKIRQELLAHLTAIFDEERTRLGNDPRALAEALRRFGRPADLTRDLQAAVPFSERWATQLVRRFFRRPNEQRFRHAVRLAAFFALVVGCISLIRPLIEVAAGRWSSAVDWARPVWVLTAYAFFSVLFAYGLCRELADRRRSASLLRAIAYGLALLLTYVALVAGSYVTPPKNAVWWFVLHYPANPLALSVLVFFIGLSLGYVLGVAMIAREEMARQRQWEDWTSLEIGE